MAQLVKNPRC